MRYGIIIDDLFTRHRTPMGHPERSGRIETIQKRLQDWSGSSRLERLDCLRACEDWILAVHTEAHLAQVKETAGHSFGQLDPDTYTSADSFEVALHACGSAVHLTRQLLEGEIDSGFALVRPPGHHAESHRAMGFCLFNNVAVAAQWAIQAGGIGRAAIIDFDVHHGNGTQEIFYARPDVLYLSTHQYPFYPGTGDHREAGSGRGRGFTVNFPIRAGMGNFFYAALFEDFVDPILRQFQPHLILVSAGYDAHHSDPLASMNLDVNGFAALVNRINRAAGDLCQGRVLYLLEGGYNLEALAESVLATISTTLEGSAPGIREDQAELYAAYRDRIRPELSAFWEV